METRAFVSVNVHERERATCCSAILVQRDRREERERECVSVKDGLL